MTVYPFLSLSDTMGQRRGHQSAVDCDDFLIVV